MCYPCLWTGVTYLCGLYTFAGMTAERVWATEKRATLMTERSSPHSLATWLITVKRTGLMIESLVKGNSNLEDSTKELRVS